MGSFNPINLIANTLNALNYSMANNIGANAAQNTPNQNQAQNSSILNQPQNNTLLTPNPLNANQSLIISTVQVEKQANYIKDLLNLPRDFETLMKMIQGQINSQGNLTDLTKLLQGGKINLALLNSIMAGNSKAAAAKLMATIIEVSKMGANNVGQLKELMAAFTSSNASSDSIQTLKNLLILYLPFLPLSVRNDMNLDFEIGVFEEGGIDDETVKIMIQTANFGNVLIELRLTDNEVDIYIKASEYFPSEKVIKKFKEDSKKTNINPNVKFEKTQEKAIEALNKQNIKVTASNFVSPKLITASHSIIKIIIDVDYGEFIIKEENKD